MWRSASAEFLALLILLGAWTASPGQSGPIAPPVAPPVAPPPGGNQPLTDANIPQMFQACGFQVEEKTDAFGKKFWIGKIQRDGWGYVIELVPYRSQQGQISGFWMKSPLGGAINPANVSSNALLNLLSLNHLQAPFFFSYNNNRLYMNFEWPYNSISQQSMQTELNLLMQKIHQTAASWTNIHNTPVPVPGASK